jgi:hypothetical protein
LLYQKARVAVEQLLVVTRRNPFLHDRPMLSLI